MTCSICSQPNRAQIDEALVEQRSLRDIARQFGVHRSSLDRHKQHIPKALAKAKNAETVAESTSLLTRLTHLVRKCEIAYEEAREDGNWTGAAAFAREIRGCLELLGKLSGELQSGRPGVNIAIATIEALDVNRLTEEQLEVLYGRVEAEKIREVRALSDEELELQCPVGFPIARSIRELLLFDNDTVPPLENYVTCNRTTENLRELDIRNGKIPRGWHPYRDSTAADRFQMLQAVWKKLSGFELDEASLAIIGPAAFATIQVEFDLTEVEDRGWDSWPKVKLRAAPQQAGTLSASASL
jgi:transposase-like protein